MDVTFPDGTVVRGVGLDQRDENHDWRSFGLYLDARWQPTWPSVVVAWEDFGLPMCSRDAAEVIRSAFSRAAAGERVEIGCAGGMGRTGTVLACMAWLAGVPLDEAVTWVRTHYRSEAVETSDQEAWVRWFAAYQSDAIDR